MLNDRPVLEIPKTRLEVFFNVLSLLMLCGNFVYIFMAWTSLPDRIPTHFNGLGEVDGWGGKGNIWVLEVIAIVLWGGLTTLEKYPHVYNYIFLTEENMARQYENARIMVNVLKTTLTFTFVLISWELIQSVKENESSLEIWTLPLLLVMIFGVIGFFIFRSYRLR
jgi:uncharacterized membrane protein